MTAAEGWVVALAFALLGLWSQWRFEEVERRAEELAELLARRKMRR